MILDILTQMNISIIVILGKKSIITKGPKEISRYKPLLFAKNPHFLSGHSKTYFWLSCSLLV